MTSIIFKELSVKHVAETGFNIDSEIAKVSDFLKIHYSQAPIEDLHRLVEVSLKAGWTKAEQCVLSPDIEPLVARRTHELQKQGVDRTLARYDPINLIFEYTPGLLRSRQKDITDERSLEQGISHICSVLNLTGEFTIPSDSSTESKLSTHDLRATIGGLYGHGIILRTVRNSVQLSRDFDAIDLTQATVLGEEDFDDPEDKESIVLPDTPALKKLFKLGCSITDTFCSMQNIIQWGPPKPPKSAVSPN